jgi:hypothetical protein
MLSRAEATPAELLAHNPDSVHDTIQVVPEPLELHDGSLVRTFLVSGVRHVDEENPDRIGDLVGRLSAGATLGLAAEPDNPRNDRALLVTTGRTPIGWVPDYLLGEVNTYLQSDGDVVVTVERANGAEAPWHMRLLCRITYTAAAAGNG